VPSTSGFRGRRLPGLDYLGPEITYSLSGRNKITVQRGVGMGCQIPFIIVEKTRGNTIAADTVKIAKIIKEMV
jgi:hypothetical protein